MTVVLAPPPLPSALRAPRAARSFAAGKCGSCIALCCRYFALEVDRPTVPRDFENLRWYLLHERVNLFVEGRRWFVQVFNRCSALGDDNRCTIYETRPAICRNYDTDTCDKDEAEGKSEMDRVFRTVEELEAYRDGWVARYRSRQRRLRREAAARRARRPRGAARAAKPRARKHSGRARAR